MEIPKLPFIRESHQIWCDVYNPLGRIENCPLFGEQAASDENVGSSKILSRTRMAPKVLAISCSQCKRREFIL